MVTTEYGTTSLDLDDDNREGQKEEHDTRSTSRDGTSRASSLMFACLLVLLLTFLYVFPQYDLSAGTTATSTQLVPSWIMDPKEPQQNQSQHHCVTTLILLRHAKSSWEDPSQADFNRPLAPEGVQSALALGQYLYTHNVPPPDYIVASPSNRTRVTLALVEQAWFQHQIPINFRQELYDDAPVSYVGFLMKQIMHLASSSYVNATCCPKTRRLLLVGHNPAMGALARALVPNNITHFKTAGYCEFHLHRGWSDVLVLLQQRLSPTVQQDNTTTAAVTLGLCTTL
mmetsp:Transcript_4542/g.8627  ORF Transcript_4542/g.8627 Transcript_4542/m.8627 type:complete len:285 (+) Transcript_4542:119-973(+)